MPSLRYTRSTNRHSRLRSITRRFDANSSAPPLYDADDGAASVRQLSAGITAELWPRRMPSQLHCPPRATVLASAPRDGMPVRPQLPLLAALQTIAYSRQLLLSRAPAILTVIHADKLAQRSCTHMPTH